VEELEHRRRAPDDLDVEGRRDPQDPESRQTGERDEQAKNQAEEHHDHGQLDTDEGPAQEIRKVGARIAEVEERGQVVEHDASAYLPGGKEAREMPHRASSGNAGPAPPRARFSGEGMGRPCSPTDRSAYCGVWSAFGMMT